MKINGSEVKTKEENSKSKKTKKVRKSSGNTSKSTSKGALASADDSKALTHQGIIGLVIAAVLIVCIVIAVVFGIKHIGKSIGSSTKNDDGQTVAEQLGSGNNSSSSSASTNEEIFPGLTDDTSKNDDILKEWEKKSLDEGDKQGADYYNRLQGTGLKKDNVSTDDEYFKIASGVVADIKTMSCDDFYAKYSKVPNKNCDVYATIQNNTKSEDPKYTDRYSDNTETWFTYNMSDSGSGFMVYVSRDSVVTDVQFAFNSPLELS